MHCDLGHIYTLPKAQLVSRMGTAVNGHHTGFLAIVPDAYHLFHNITVVINTAINTTILKRIQYPFAMIQKMGWRSLQ